MSYRQLNVYLGWGAGALALVVYLLTLEPTASFWDCGEFIATAYKLQVGHPPGAPLFAMLGRLASLGAAPEDVAWRINALSALCSALTITFLFWTISYLGRSLIERAGHWSRADQWAVLGSALVGSLACAFSDTFWFSAVEAEVYSMSSLFTALVFWAALRWEGAGDRPGANRWLLLIAYLIGLSIGVHLLNLLALPSLVFLYYYRKFPVSRVGAVAAFLVGLCLLWLVQHGIIPGSISLAYSLEFKAVNSWGMSFDSGLVIFLGLLFLGLLTALILTRRMGKRNVHQLLLGLSLIYIGFSSYAMVYVRSAADPPIDENNPENAIQLLSYLNREQYGSRPLVYGPQFNSPLHPKKPRVDAGLTWYPNADSGRYVVADSGKMALLNYHPDFMSFFPRMYSSRGSHRSFYRRFGGFEGIPTGYELKNGQTDTINKPTQGENFSFFMRYQVMHMYARYFLWNFVGRQNDLQGHGGTMKGQWETGIDAIDSAVWTDRENLPIHLANNPARNHYYALPLLLGLLGLFYHARNRPRHFWVVALLFFFTGLAIVIYLNQTPLQPRERDYAFAGSFYAFTIWIGLGVLALFRMLRSVISEKTALFIGTGAMLLVVPTNMAIQGWDDHDRSDRTVARDFARNYLASCAENAILFTHGDNDTFPLWYVQEVEDFRTDVRVVNTSLLNLDWYVDQMKRRINKSAPLPLSMKTDQYRQGTRDYVHVIDRTPKDRYTELGTLFYHIIDDNERTPVNGRLLNMMPNPRLSLRVDSAELVSTGTLTQEEATDLEPYMRWDCGRSYVSKADLVLMDLLTHNRWERPIYFAPSGREAYFGLESYLRLEGRVLRLVPLAGQEDTRHQTFVNADSCYHRLMNTYDWGGFDRKDTVTYSLQESESLTDIAKRLRVLPFQVLAWNNDQWPEQPGEEVTLVRSVGAYADESTRWHCRGYRKIFADVANALSKEGDEDKAIQLLDRCLEVFPEQVVPYRNYMVAIADAYYQAGATTRGDQLVARLADLYEYELLYYLELPYSRQVLLDLPMANALKELEQLEQLTTELHPQSGMREEMTERMELLRAVLEPSP